MPAPARSNRRSRAPARRKRRGRRSPLARGIRWTLGLLAAFLLVRALAFAPFRVPSGSMRPTLQVGDVILVEKLSYGAPALGVLRKLSRRGPPRRGDVIVFRHPQDSRTHLVKRVVAVPGDTLSVGGGGLILNGRAVPRAPAGTSARDGEAGPARRFEERIDGRSHQLLQSGGGGGAELSDARIPEGRYFVMGDHRDRSRDSRHWGAVPEDAIVGRAFLVLWSWDGRAHAPRWERIGLRVR